MRTIVDIPEPDLAWLATHCKAEEISRAEAVRRALGEYRSKHELSVGEREAEFEKVLARSAGIFKNDPFWQGRDSVEYVRSIRDEWEDPWEQR
jgi:hypothetical protein